MKIEKTSINTDEDYNKYFEEIINELWDIVDVFSQTNINYFYIIAILKNYMSKIVKNPQNRWHYNLKKI